MKTNEFKWHINALHAFLVQQLLTPSSLASSSSELSLSSSCSKKDTLLVLPMVNRLVALPGLCRIGEGDDLFGGEGDCRIGEECRGGEGERLLETQEDWSDAWLGLVKALTWGEILHFWLSFGLTGLLEDSEVLVGDEWRTLTFGLWLWACSVIARSSAFISATPASNGGSLLQKIESDIYIYNSKSSTK